MMKVLALALVAIFLVSAAFAEDEWDIEICYDTGCTNCTSPKVDGTTFNDGCASISGASTKLDCSGDNATVTSYANYDCSGSPATTSYFKVGCSTSGSLSVKVTCAASSIATVVVAVAMMAAALLI